MVSTINIFMKKCELCNLEFEKSRSYSNHVRWKHKSEPYHNMIACVYCEDMYIPHINHFSNCIKHPDNLRSCKQCGDTFAAVRYNKAAQFCGHKCSATFNNLNRNLSDRKFKISSCSVCNKEMNVKAHVVNSKCLSCKIKQKIIHTHTCVICNTSYTSARVIHKTCSKTCKNKLNSINSTNNPNCGGETNYKRYVRNGIMFDSTWEVEIAEFLDSHSIKWTRDRKMVLHWIDGSGAKRRYYPDFYLSEYNVYIDPKNPYKQLMDAEKLAYIQQHHVLIVGDVNQCKTAVTRILNGGGAN